MKLANPFSRLDETKLKEVLRRLVAELHPRAVYLFGSHVRGVPNRDSDIDLMLLVDEKLPGIELQRRGYTTLHGLGLPVELHISSRERFERFADVFGSFQHEIRRKGVLLYAAED